MKDNDWNALFREWEALLSPQLGILNQEAIEFGLIRENVSGVCNQECSNSQIKKAEARLGASLPKSYKEFLLHTNGANLLERPLFLLSIDEIDWYRNVEPGNISAWEKDAVSVSDEQYIVYGKYQDCIHMRAEYLNKCLTLSSSIDGDIYLLNPCIKAEGGEWEAWNLGFKHPGAVRYRSFWDLMVERLSSVEAYLER